MSSYTNITVFYVLGESEIGRWLTSMSDLFATDFLTNNINSAKIWKDPPPDEEVEKYRKLTGADLSAYRWYRRSEHVAIETIEQV